MADKEKQHQAEDKERSRSHEKDNEKSAEKKTSRSRTSTKAENKAGKSQQEHVSNLPAGKSATTTDHNTIRQWVEARGGSPAAVKATEKGEDPGLLRINFPGYSGENRLENISWDEFFKKFDEKKLAFLYQEEKRSGEESRFWKFVSREGDGGSHEGTGGSRSGTASSSRGTASSHKGADKGGG